MITAKITTITIKPLSGLGAGSGVGGGEEGLSPPIPPGWARPSAGGLSAHCRARPVEVNGADARWLYVPTRVNANTGLTAVLMPPYLGIFS